MESPVETDNSLYGVPEACQQSIYDEIGNNGDNNGDSENNEVSKNGCTQTYENLSGQILKSGDGDYEHLQCRSQDDLENPYEKCQITGWE